MLLLEDISETLLWLLSLEDKIQKLAAAHLPCSLMVVVFSSGSMMSGGTFCGGNSYTIYHNGSTTPSAGLYRRRKELITSDASTLYVGKSWLTSLLAPNYVLR